MEIIENESVKVPNSVIVSEIAGDEQLDEVIEFLKQYGSISRVLKMNDSKSEFYRSVIVEYSSGFAVESLDPLPRTHVSDSGASYRIQSLASV